MSLINNSFNKTEREIIDKLMEGGHARRRGEEELFATFSYLINNGKKKYALSEDESFDMYSDTVLVTIDKIITGQFEGRSSLKTYIFQIFHNKCVDLIRKKSTNKYSVNKTTSLSDMLVQISDGVKPIIEKIIERCDWETLRSRLLELGDNCRQLLTLSSAGYSDKEIAVAMEYKSADVVKTSRLRCLEKLRQLYKK